MKIAIITDHLRGDGWSEDGGTYEGFVRKVLRLPVRHYIDGW